MEMIYLERNDAMKTLQEMIDESNNIVFFGGAGVSTASGIPDFRSDTGLYHKYPYRAEIMLSHTYFMHHTEEFFQFYFKEMIHKNAKPNACHRKLRELEQSGKLKMIVTQNIDGLHQMAGSKHVLELHGTVHKNTCMKCHKQYSLEEIGKNHICSCGGIIKPDVVLYEEPLPSGVFEKAIEVISNCDTFIVGGTSLAVYPANSLVQFFHGKNLVVINKDKTSLDQKATLVIHDDIAKVFSKIKTD